ncbi:MAG: hypothetical protein M3N05_02525 [Pseudomonadota bacterium]|nr:hypothetical protein [Pseudomonadota bacterium]
MSLQNRVDPFGHLIATPARGARIGNRGLLHGADRQIRRSWRLKAWLVCTLQFKGRHRTVMSPGLWTELFFLDEATALAAGHRPCCECRRTDHLRFKTLAGQATGEPFKRAADLDAALHHDRITTDNAKRTYRERIGELPEGVFVLVRGEPWLKQGGGLHRWTPHGYAETCSIPAGEAEVLTPRLTVETIRGGYAPQMAL